MREDLRAGYAVVVPADAVAGWWRTDPVTGHTLGVSSTGWGQSAIEKVAIFFGAVAVGWTLEYLLCSGSLYVPGLS